MRRWWPSEAKRLARRRGSFPVVVAAVAVIVASELLDDAQGDKSLTTWIVSVAIGLVAYAVAEWDRRRWERSRR